MFASLSGETHSQAVYRKLIAILTNVYFNNHCTKKADKDIVKKYEEDNTGKVCLK